MKHFFTTRKAMALLSCVALASLAVGATFAWTSLNSQKVNEWHGTATDTVTGPGGSLHDDHDNDKGNDAMKDVYVENWGDKPFYVRIKLSSYMEIGKNAGSIDVDAGTGELYRKADNEALPVVQDEAALISKNDRDYLKFLPHVPLSSDVSRSKHPFDQYWVWAMGDGAQENSQKIYRPATEEQKRAASTEKGSVVTDTTVYTALADGLKETLSCKVIHMAKWLDLPETDNNFYWVYDEDGWAYWSHMLKPGNATGLLMHEVYRTDKKIDDKYFYAINVQAQMATLDEAFGVNAANGLAEDDVTSWITGDKGTEIASEGAKSLLRTAYKKAVNEGLFGDIEINDEKLDHIFKPDSRPSES